MRCSCCQVIMNITALAMCLGSSHMARRTFIANIYNKVSDPNVIGSMTGHVEGSRAFARYRTIEEGVKKSLVDILG